MSLSFIVFNNCGSHIPSSAITDSEKNPAIIIDEIFFVIFLFLFNANIMKWAVLSNLATFVFIEMLTIF